MLDFPQFLPRIYVTHSPLGDEPRLLVQASLRVEGVLIIQVFLNSFFDESLFFVFTLAFLEGDPLFWGGFWVDPC